MATSASQYNSSVLSAGLSAVCGTTVLTYDEYLEKRPESYNFLDLDAVHQYGYTYVCGPLGPQLISQSYHSREITIFIQKIGEWFPIKVCSDEEIGVVKQKICDEKGVVCCNQKLMFAGRVLDDDRRVMDCGIRDGSVVLLVYPCSLPYVLRGGSLDPHYDYDFTGLLDDGTTYCRGGHEYHSPYGWYRYGLRVKGRYENDVWLGALPSGPGRRIRSSPGEWPVSYHGTAFRNAPGIISDGYQRSRIRRDIFNKNGIYQAPRIETAEHFATSYTCGGKWYKIVFQNRVANFEVIPSSQTEYGEYWVQCNPEKYMRPYGICIKECMQRRV